MLVLTRKVGEQLLIGENVSVTIVAIVNGAVRLGIEAPREVPIMRTELRDQMLREQQALEQREHQAKLNSDD